MGTNAYSTFLSVAPLLNNKYKVDMIDKMTSVNNKTLDFLKRKIFSLSFPTIILRKGAKVCFHVFGIILPSLWSFVPGKIAS